MPQCADVIGSVGAEAVGLDTDTSTDAAPDTGKPDAPSTASGQRRVQRLVFSASEVPFFLIDLFQHAVFQHGFGQHFLQLSVFFF